MQDRWGNSVISDVLRAATRMGEDKMRTLFVEYGFLKSGTSLSIFNVSFLLLQVAFVLLYAFLVRYGEEADRDHAGVDTTKNASQYPLFQV